MPLSAQDRDMMVRTIIGEAGDQSDLGQAAVGHVILNRVQTGRWGKTPSDVVLARSQFEPWSTRAKELLNIKPSSKAYQNAARIVDDVVEGRTPDPTRGSTHFLDPNVVRGRRGGSLPDWARGDGIVIGGHTFYAPEGRVQRASAQPGDGQALAFDTTPEADELFRALGITIPPAQGAPRAPRAAPGANAPAPQPAAPAPAATSQGYDPETQRVLDYYGINPKAAAGEVAKTTPPEITNPPENPLGPTLEKRAQDLSVARGPGGAMIEGMPVVGPTLDATASAGAAALQPGSFPENYAKNQAVVRRSNALYAERHPYVAGGMNFLGAAGTYGPMASTNVGRFAMGLPNRVWPSAGGQVYSGIGGGAGINALDAAMRGDDVGAGATVGAGAGAAGPLVSWGLRSGVPFVRNALARPPEALRDINPIARSWLIDAAHGGATDNIGPLGFYGEQNPELTKILQGISFGRGEGSGVVRGAYDARGKQMFPELEADLDKAFGPRTNVVENERLLTEARAKAADPLYEKWRNAEIVPTPELKKIMNDAGKLGLFATAEEHATLRNQAFNTKTKIIPAKEAGKFKKGWGSDPDTKYVHPATESWDMIKRALDARIDTAYGAGNKTLAADLISFKRRMLDEIEKQPAGQIWKQARAEFADKSALIDQVGAGHDTFLGGRSGLSVDEMREELRHLSRPELMARIQGARNAVSDAMGDTLRGTTTMRDKLLAPNNREKLSLMLGKDKADELIESLGQKSTLAKKSQTVMGGSQTASNQEAVKALQAPPHQPWNFNFMQPQTWLPPRVVDELRPSNIFAARREQAYGEAGNALAGKLTIPYQGARAKELDDAIFKEATRRAAAAHRGERMGNALNAMVVAPSAETFRLRAYEPKQPLAISGP